MNKPWQPLRIPSAIRHIGQLHQSPPSPIPGELGRGPSHQSHVLEHRDTYGQAQVCSKGHQGSSVDRPCQPSFHWIKFWHGRNPLPQSIDNPIAGNVEDQTSVNTTGYDHSVRFVEDLLSVNTTDRICLSALLGRPGRVKFILNGLRWEKKTNAPITPLCFLYVPWFSHFLF